MSGLPDTVRKALRGGVLVGLVLGLVYSIGGLIADLVGPGLNTGTALAFLALVGMPVLFGAVGCLIGGIAYKLRHH